MFVGGHFSLKDKSPNVRVRMDNMMKKIPSMKNSNMQSKGRPASTIKMEAKKHTISNFKTNTNDSRLLYKGMPK